MNNSRLFANMEYKIIKFVCFLLIGRFRMEQPTEFINKYFISHTPSHSAPCRQCRSTLWHAEQMRLLWSALFPYGGHMFPAAPWENDWHILHLPIIWTACKNVAICRKNNTFLTGAKFQQLDNSFIKYFMRPIWVVRYSVLHTIVTSWLGLPTIVVPIQNMECSVMEYSNMGECWQKYFTLKYQSISLFSL